MGGDWNAARRLKVTLPRGELGGFCRGVVALCGRLKVTLPRGELGGFGRGVAALCVSLFSIARFLQQTATKLERKPH